ncbi:MAG: winged helix-turn-helix transcriptional regulator [Chloroflexota bacterium]
MKAETDDIVRWFEIVQWQQGSWVPEIVLVLAQGPTRFTDLCRAIRARNTDRWWFIRRSQLSNSQLSRTLHAMERDELVLRHEDRSRVPSTVIYELSPLLIDFLAGPIGPAVKWLRHHDEPIERVRERRRRRRDDPCRPDCGATARGW